MITLHGEQSARHGVNKLLNLTPRMQLGLHAIQMNAVRIPRPARQRRLALARTHALSDDVHRGPRVESIGDVLFPQVDAEAGKVLRVAGAVQPILQGELKHDAGEHHGGFLAGGTVGEGPGAEQGQGFAYVVDLWDLAEGGPDHLLERMLQLDEQGGLGRVVTSGDSDDGPMEEGMEVIVLLVGEVWVQNGEEWVVGSEVDLVEFRELVIGEGHVAQRGGGGAGCDGRVAHRGEFAIPLAEVQQATTGCRLVGAEEGLLA